METNKIKHCKDCNVLICRGPHVRCRSCDVEETSKKVLKGLQEASAGLTEGPFKTVDELMESIHRKYNLFDWIEIYWHRWFWNYVSAIPLEIKSFIQRGIRGYSDKDTWDFDSYLSKVIKGGVQHLIDIEIKRSECPQDKGAGFCCECLECLECLRPDKKRREDFKKIVETMEIAESITETYDKALYIYRMKEFKKGMLTLTKRFFELWD